MKTHTNLTLLSKNELTELNGGSTVPTYDNSDNYEAGVEIGESIITFVYGFFKGLSSTIFS